MITCRLSTKGQLIIPKEVRERHHWQAGTELEVTDRGDVVELRRTSSLRPTTIHDLVGCANIQGGGLTLHDMSEAIDRAAREDWERLERSQR